MASTRFKIQITNPCANDWETMKISSEGRFCESCSKHVVDFSSKSDEEIKAYFLAKKDEPICGRFQKQQVNRIRIEIDQAVLYSAVPFWQKFLVVVLVCFGPDFLGVDFCLAQTDSTAIHIEQIDSLAAEAVQQDTVVCADTSLLEPGFLSHDIPPFDMAVLSADTTIDFSRFMVGFSIITSELDEPLTITVDAPIVLDTAQVEPTAADTGKAAAFDLPFGLISHEKSREPKNTPDHTQLVMIVEEKKRRKRKPKGGEKNVE